MVYLSFFYFLLHPYFVSQTVIAYSPEDKQFQIVCTFFADDVERELHQAYPKYQFNFFNQTIDDSTNARIGAYYKKKLALRINRQATPLSFLGCEYDNTNLSCYFAVPYSGSHVKSVDVDNTILYQTQPEQAHIIQLKYKTFNQTQRIKNPLSTCHFDL